MYFKVFCAAFFLVMLSGCAFTYPQEDLMRQEKAIKNIEQQAAFHHEQIAALREDMDQVRTSLDLLREETALRLMDLEIKIEPGADYDGQVPYEEEDSQALFDVTLKIPESLKMPEPARDKPEPATDRPDFEQSLYDKALAHYFDGESEQARDKFKSFIEKYPGSRLVPNAWYWMGETYYLENDYPQAILTFRQVLEEYPDDPKAPDSLLKIGYSYERLKDFRNALFYLGILTQDYPESSSARKASNKVRELRDKV